LDLISLLHNKITPKNLLLSLYFLGRKITKLVKTSYKNFNTNFNIFIFFYYFIIFYNKVLFNKTLLFKIFYLPLYLYFFSFNFIKFLFSKFNFEKFKEKIFSLNFKSSFFQISSFSFLNYLRKENKFSKLKPITDKFNLLLTNNSRLSLNINFFFWFKFFNKTNFNFLNIPFLLK
jgi:hypothetical protein